MFSDEEIKKARKDLISINEELFRKSSEAYPLPKAKSQEKPILYLFRHGQSVDNENFVFCGWRDSPLTKTGREQASVLAIKLIGKRVDLGIHSHLVRSRETLDIVFRELLPRPTLEEDDRIIERNYGFLQGKSKVELFLENPKLYEEYHRDYEINLPLCENFKMVEDRVFPFCSELETRMKKEKINVALSAHSNSMRAIRRYFEKLTVEQMCQLEDPLAQDYASYAIS